jgi:hypothetical protein
MLTAKIDAQQTLSLETELLKLVLLDCVFFS